MTYSSGHEREGVAWVVTDLLAAEIDTLQVIRERARDECALIRAVGLLLARMRKVCTTPERATYDCAVISLHDSLVPEWPVVLDRKSTRLNSSHSGESRMPSSA